MRWQKDVGTLANWRANKPRIGPAFFKVGRGVRYYLSVIKKWEAKHVVK